MHINDSLLLDCYFSISCTFRIIFPSIFTSIVMYIQDSVPLNFYVCILRTFKILFHRKVSSYLVNFKDSQLSLNWYLPRATLGSPSSDCYVNTLVPRTLKGFSAFSGLLRWYLPRAMPCIFRIQFHSIFTFVSCAHLRASFIGKLVRILWTLRILGFHWISTCLAQH